MGYKTFDKFACEYDAWFIENQAVLETEVKLVAHALSGDIGKTLSIGCGSGLFEHFLNQDYGVKITNGVEPAEGMANIARQRGVDVEIATAEEVDMGVEQWDTILFNGSPCYIEDLKKAFEKSFKALKKGGRIIVIDVPKESPFGTIYNLAMTLGSWEHPLLDGTQPKDPYPIELVKSAAWRTTPEKVELLTQCGFTDFKFAQSLTQSPRYAHLTVEEPVEGYDKGSYVAITAYKK